MPDEEKNGDSVEEDLEDVAETLENSDEAVNEPSSKAEAYEEAYREWQENDNTELLENLVHQEGLQHRYRTLSKLRKKGKYTSYDKLDAGVTGATLTGAAYIIHAVIASGWVLVAVKILVDSLNDVESENFYKKLDEFGPELFYFLVFTAAAVLVFDVFWSYTLTLENGGTIPTIFSEVMQFVR